jgi:4-amino-4-deoxy-L-arabinose transferase-like glycosyltransferase
VVALLTHGGQSPTATMAYPADHADNRQAQPESGSATRHTWRPSSFAIVATAVLALAVFQNFYRLSVAPLLPNEALYARMGWLYLHWASVPAAQREFKASNAEHPPLVKVLFGLSQLIVGHPSVTAARAVDACCVIATSTLLAWWLGRVVNKWAGLLSGALLALIPMPIFLDATRFGRTASLDTVAQLFMVASLVLGWHWVRASTRRGWAFAAGTGICVGLAAASRENAFLGILGPLLLAFFWARTSWSRLASWLGQLLLVLGTAVAVLVACYLPFGDVLPRIHYLLAFQTGHSFRGHLVGVAGRMDIHPPWWANFWFAGHSLGPSLSFALLTTAAIGALLRRDAVIAWLVTSMIGPIVFHCFYAGVSLPHYWTLWTPAVIALSATGIFSIGRWLHSGFPLWRRAVAGIAVTAIALAIVPAILAETDRVANLKSEGARAVASLRAARGLHGAIVTAGTYPDEVNPLLPGATILTALPANPAGVDTILLAKPRCGRLISRQLRAFIQVNVATGAVQLIHTDRLMRVYVITGPVTLPSPEQIRSFPPVKFSDNC